MKYLRRKDKQTGAVQASHSSDSSTLPHLAYSPVLRIHKAWRHYKDFRLPTTQLPDLSSTTTTPPNNNNNKSSTEDTTDIFSLSSSSDTTTTTTTATTSMWQLRLDNHRFCNNNNNNNHHNSTQDITNNNIIYHSTHDLSIISTNNNNNNNNFKLQHPLIESDPNSISSDHSELNESFKGQLACLDLSGITTTTTTNLTNKQHNDQFNKIFHNLHKSSSSSPGGGRGGGGGGQKVDDDDGGGDDDDEQKKIRKTNLLKLASEFAELKGLQHHALPLDLPRHKETCSGNTSDTDVMMIPYDHHHHQQQQHPQHHHQHHQLVTNDINNNVGVSNNGLELNDGEVFNEKKDDDDDDDDDDVSTKVKVTSSHKCGGLKGHGCNGNGNSVAKEAKDKDGSTDRSMGHDNDNDGGDDCDNDDDDEEEEDKEVYHACDYGGSVNDIRGCGDGGCDNDDGCDRDDDDHSGVKKEASVDNDDIGGDGMNAKTDKTLVDKDTEKVCPDSSSNVTEPHECVNGKMDVTLSGDNNKHKLNALQVISINNKEENNNDNNNPQCVNFRHKSSMSRSTSNRHLKDGEEEKKKIWQHRLSTREDILKKLASEADEDSDSSTNQHSAGLFYVNEAANDIEKEKQDGAGSDACGGDDGSSSGNVGSGEVKRGVAKGINNKQAPSLPAIGGSNKKVSKSNDVIGQSKVGGVSCASKRVAMGTKATPDIIASTNDMHASEDYTGRQERLQREAKMALAQARPMAYMQLQLEKKKFTKSPLADILGMETFVEGQLVRLSLQRLQCMNVAQLQVVVNELHASIEVLNSDLMDQLVDRDDLHTVQDSMLVDIEDLTGRAQEFAAKTGKGETRS